VPWRRFAGLSFALACGYGLGVGLLAGVIPNPFTTRVLPVNIWNVLSVAVPGALTGPLAATYLVRWPTACRVGGRAGAGGVLSCLGAACPVCNRIVVAAIGVSGATDYFRPLQPLLAVGSTLLLGLALRARWCSRVPSLAAATG
jgi:hypothetical protein